MKHKLLLALAAASALTACSTDQNSSRITVLKAENQLLKQQLAALGKDTADVLLKDLTAKAGMSDTTVTAGAGSIATSSTTGMWMVRHYVDDFGAETKRGYVSNAQKVQGTFSNSATQDSELLVDFMIEKDLSIAIQLYEYARNNPVKSYGSDSYQVNVKDKDGKAYHLRAVNYESDRMTFDKPDAKRLHAILLKGGRIQFAIRESDTPTTVYNFTIENAGGYLDARKQLKS